MRRTKLIRRIIPATLFIGVLCVIVAQTPTRSVAATSGVSAISQLPVFARRIACVPGAWAEYRISKPGKPRARHIKMGCPGTVSTKKGPAWWFEISGTARGVIPYAVRLLIRGRLDDPGAVQRTIIKLGRSPAMEMPSKGVKVTRRFKSKPTTLPAGVTISSKKVRIKVKAGTFTCTEYILRKKGSIVGRYHLNRKLHPLAVIKVDEPRVRMELVARGSGFRSVIKEKPTRLDLDMMQRMRGRVGRRPAGDSESKKKNNKSESKGRK